jgi:hypothetical protein
MLFRNLAILLLAVISCSKKEGPFYVIDLKSVREFNVLDLEITKMAQLEATDYNLLGMYLDVQLDNGNLWVLDLNNPNSVFGFDPEGKSLGYVAATGEGPNNLINIRDFFVSNDTIVVLSNLGDKVDISMWSPENSLIKKRRVDANGFAFCQDKFSKDWYVYSGYNKVAGEYRLKTFDKDLNFITEDLKNDFNDELLPFYEKSFFPGVEGVLFKESLRPAIFSIRNGQRELLYKVDLGAYQVPEEFWEVDPFEGFELINQKGFANIGFLAESKDHFLIEIQIQNINGIKKELLILEKNSGKTLKLEVNQEGTGHFYSPIGFDGDGNILFSAYAQFFRSNKDKILTNLKGNLGIEEIKEDGNPVVIYAEIPEFK